jgi:7-cyano-7-deazaguanine synthase in queuosine biosynthesis
MKANNKELALVRPRLAVHVAEPGTRTRRGAVRCEIDKNVSFSTESLESYFFARWEPLAYDALLVAAAAEFADRTQKRSAYIWEREFHLVIPVHEPDHWNNRRVVDTLQDALAFLTGDRWSVEFYKRNAPPNQPRQGLLGINANVDAVIPFSNGLDSRAVAALKSQELGDKLVRIRLGSKVQDDEGLSNQREAFTSVPYKVKVGERRTESTARSRGFKFALISSLAAFLSGARQVIVPESGQGALGPALVPVGQAYEDFRSHPLFTKRMEKFVKALFDYDVGFVFPRLWHTKAETLRAFVDACDPRSSWVGTWSCWQQNRQVSVDHRRRHCGICAACMLRRLSVHAAGLQESKERYVWEDLSAQTFFEGGADGGTNFVD